MKKILITIVIFIILFSSTLSISNKNNITSEKVLIENQKITIIFVDKNNSEGPWDGTVHHPFQKISDAIAIAEENDIISVLNGIYKENIAIDKSIFLIGESKESTIIDGRYQEYILNITADGTIIEKFTIINSGGYLLNAGIIINANDCLIKNCIIKRNRNGVLIKNTQRNTIENSTLYLNGKAITSLSDKDLSILNNEICHSGIGINLKNSYNVNIVNSYIHESGVAMNFDKTYNIYILKSAICDNNDNSGGITIDKSENITIENSNILHNGYGLEIFGSKKIEIKHCDIENLTHFGLWLEQNNEDIKIRNSSLTNNFRHCISMIDSKCTVEYSNLFNNWIESINVEDSLCIARYNYWGGKLGPLFNKGVRLPDIFKPHFRKLIYFPWNISKFENAGSNWEVEDNFVKTNVYGYEDEPINFEGNDTDYDGLPDWWEQEFGYSIYVFNDHKNLDLDEDGLNNFEECYAYNWGANPFKKDIFLEFDWTPTSNIGKTNKPSEEILDNIKQRFEEHNITLHVDLGQLNGGGKVSYITDFNYDELVNIYWDNFLNNDLTNPRKNIFHYGFICDRGPGGGFAVIGWGHLNSFCMSADALSENFTYLDRQLLITCGSIHEVGHTLGLVVDDFGGNDNHAAVRPQYKEFWQYRNYKSLMNYRYTYYVLDFSDGDNGKVDYNDWEGMELDFFKNTHFEWPKT